MIDFDLAKTTLRSSCIALGLQEDVQLVEIKPGNRLILYYYQDQSKPDFAKNMIKLERHMKETLQVRSLELLLEALEDRNKRDLKSGRKVEKLVNARNVERLD